MVLIVQGSSARMTPETEKLPIDAAIIGIVDSVNVENEMIFSALFGLATDRRTAIQREWKSMQVTR